MDYKLYYSKYKGSEVDAAIDQIPNKLDKSAKGVANGVASLGADGKVPKDQLPQIDSGKVDTVSVNSGTPIQPDASKNINIAISKTTVGLGNVDNTSDANKPVSTAQQTELNKKLDKTGGAINGNLSISGDLVVNGTEKVNNVENLNVKDQMIYANSEGAALAGNAGLGIKKDKTNIYGIVYDEADDAVKLGLGTADKDGKFTFNDGEGSAVAARSDSSTLTDNHLLKWNAEKKKLEDSGKTANDFVNKAGDTVNGDLSVTGKLLVAGDDIHSELYENVLPHIGSLENDVAGLDTRLSNVQNDITSVDAQVAAAKQKAEAAQSDIDKHKADKANPHGVTKSQVGLGNVDNTADKNKPVSVAQQAAIDAKFDKPTNAGVAGQVLTKTASGSEWKDAEKPDVTAAGNNTFTGENTFEDIRANGNLYLDGENSKIQVRGADYEFPTSGGTIALMGNIPDTTDFATKAGDNSFTGNNTFKVDSLLTAGSPGFGPTSDDELIITRTTPTPGKEFLSFGFISNNNNPQPAIKAQASNSPRQSVFTFPTEKAASTYTLATTDDIPDTSKFVTTDGTNNFNGENIFTESPLIINGCPTTIANTNVTIENSVLYLEQSLLQADGADFTFPKTGGTFATTSDIPDTSSFAKLSGANEFTEPNTFASYDPDTGVKVFEATAQGKSFVATSLDESGNTLRAVALGMNGPVITDKSNSKQTQYRMDAIRKVDSSGEENIIETYKLPEKGKTGSYTFATTDDVMANPTLSGSETALTGISINGTDYKIESGGGSGDVTAAGNNTFTGSNTFNSSLTAKSGITVASGGSALNQTVYGNGVISVRNPSLFTRSYNFSYGSGTPGQAESKTVATTDDTPIYIDKTIDSFPTDGSTVSISFTSTEASSMKTNFNKVVVRLTSGSIVRMLYPSECITNMQYVFVSKSSGSYTYSLTMTQSQTTGGLTYSNVGPIYISKTTTSAFPSSTGDSFGITFTNADFLNLSNNFEKCIIKITSSNGSTPGSLVLLPCQKLVSGTAETLKFNSVSLSSGSFYSITILGTTGQTGTATGLLAYNKPAISAATLSGTTLNITLG